MSGLRPAASVELQDAGWAELDQVMEVMNAAFDPRFGEAWTRAQCAGILPMRGVKTSSLYFASIHVNCQPVSPA